jgi:hypothetical protein
MPSHAFMMYEGLCGCSVLAQSGFFLENRAEMEVVSDKNGVFNRWNWRCWFVSAATEILILAYPLLSCTIY